MAKLFLTTVAVIDMYIENGFKTDNIPKNIMKQYSKFKLYKSSKDEVKKLT